MKNIIDTKVNDFKIRFAEEKDLVKLYYHF